MSEQKNEEWSEPRERIGGKLSYRNGKFPKVNFPPFLNYILFVNYSNL